MTDDNRPDYKAIAMQWLVQQGVSTVLLFCILMLLGWGIHYTVNVAVPEAIKLVQVGYDRMQEAHNKEEAERRREVDRVITTLEKAMEKLK